MNKDKWTGIAAPLAVGLLFLLLWHAVIAINRIPPMRAHCPVAHWVSVTRPLTTMASANAMAPNAVQIARYAPTKYAVGTNDRPASRLPRSTRSNRRTIGAAAGNIIATIIATHIARKSGAAMPMVRSRPVAIPSRIDIDVSEPACHATRPQPIAESTSRPTRMALRGRARGPNPCGAAAFVTAVITRSS